MDEKIADAPVSWQNAGIATPETALCNAVRCAMKCRFTVSGATATKRPALSIILIMRFVFSFAGVAASDETDATAIRK